jgi:hypothetical protein
MKKVKIILRRKKKLSGLFDIVRPPDPTPCHFPGQPFPQDLSLLIIQKATIRRFLEAEMLLICTK